ncbi:hypothetical protein BDV96DRAFT_643149 [Lophiotrema nucula]|uniref:Uncharacterized protein n=1 Tax=Lophiotrema nucula TaxID=690887 RepID=A0A6A5ZKL7_9PLEO|nr:hypothetical protein BDV96DRAFT_643149 [Lophiotrema nucula]
MEEDEDDESLMSDAASAISPRGSVVPTSWRPMYRTHRRINTLPNRRTSISSISSSHSRSASGSLPTRKPSWKPNLKQELLKEQPGPFGKRVSDASTISQFEDEIGKARRSNWGSIDLTTSTIRLGLTKRKGSTLLHPSPAETPEAEVQREELVVSEVMIRPRLTERQGSTLLHPSPADDNTPETATRPEPVRKSSTLLHPSSPAIESASSTTERRNAHAFPFPLKVTTPQSTPSIVSTPSTLSDTSSITTPSPLLAALPLKTNNTWVFPPQKPKLTTTTSAFTKIWKDEEEEEKLWPTDPEASSSSDTESLHEGEGNGFSIVMAQTAKLARASQVTLGGHVRSRSAWT